jgi:hypothetical protein
VALGTGDGVAVTTIVSWAHPVIRLAKSTAVSKSGLARFIVFLRCKISLFAYNGWEYADKWSRIPFQGAATTGSTPEMSEAIVMD